MTDHLDPRLDAYLEELRTALREVPAPEIADRHLAAMVEESRRPQAAGWWARAREAAASGIRPGPALRAGWALAGLVALLGLAGGLATANVLPDPAQRFAARAVDHVGIDLPDPDGDGKVASEDENEGRGVDAQDEHVDAAANDHGDAVVEVAQDPDLSGCEKGQAVSEVASAENQADEDAPGQDEERDPCENEGAPAVTGEGEDGPAGPPEDTPAGAGAGAEDVETGGRSGDSPGLADHRPGSLSDPGEGATDE